jgi:hypothetical protein
MLGGSPAANSTARTSFARGLARRKPDNAHSPRSGARPPRTRRFSPPCRLLHCVEYFRLNAALLCSIGCVHFIDSVCRTTYFHVNSSTSNNKAKCSLFQELIIYLLSPHPTLEVVLLHRYRKYIRLLGEFIVFGSVDISSPTQWIYFLRLTGFIFFGSGYIFLGSVDLLSSALDTFSSAQWIYFLRLWIHLLRLSEFIFLNLVDLSSSA